MKVLLIVTIALGAGIGLSLPTGRPPAAAPVPLVPAARPVPATPPVDQPVATVLERRDSGHFLTFADVNGEPVRFVVDTGADTVALTQDDARRAHVMFDPAQFEVIGRGASGDVRGQVVTLADVSLDGKHASAITGVVLENSPVSLLGQTYLRHVANVQISGDTMTLR